MKFVLLNGPPRSGKSTLAHMLKDHIGPDRCAVIGFSTHLKRMVHGIYGLAHDLDPEFFDAVKGEPQEAFLGLTPRQAYIWWSENGAKKCHDKRFFGQMFLRAAEASGKEFIVVPDSGFREEAEVVVDAVGPENVLLVQLTRANTSFDGDSRSYIDLRDLGVLLWHSLNPKDQQDLMLEFTLRGIDAAFGDKFL
jgi:hypothetical protein